MTPSLNFRAAYCEKTRCQESAFERSLFWRGLYRHAVPVAFVIRLLAPRFFRDDEEFIRFLGRDVSMDEVAEDVERFQYGNRVRRHWLRTGLRIHVNPLRVEALARGCLAF